MTAFKVLGPALLCGLLFVFVGAFVSDGLERPGRLIASSVIGVGGMLLGAIIGAAQAIVDAIERQPGPAASSLGDRSPPP